MALAILETSDRADHRALRVQAERGTGTRVGRSEPEMLRVDSVLEQHPATLHAALLALDAQRVRVDDHRVDLARDVAPRPPGLPILTGETPLAGETQRHPGEPSRQHAHQRRAPLIPVHDVDAVAPKRLRRRDDRPQRARRGQSPADAERAHAHAAGPQLVLDLATGSQREHLDGEARGVDQGEHLLEVALRPTGSEQGRKQGDPDGHAAARPASPIERGSGTRSDCEISVVSTYWRMQITSPMRT